MIVSDSKARRWVWRLVGMVIGFGVVISLFSGRAYFLTNNYIATSGDSEASLSDSDNETGTSDAPTSIGSVDEITSPGSAIDSSALTAEQLNEEVQIQEPTDDEVGEDDLNDIQSDDAQESVVPPIELSSETSPGTTDSPVRLDSALRWSKVWRAFRSERTAKGFADYISDSTGLLLRVNSLSDRGEYYVEVSHITEAEHRAAIERIVQATGYRPPEQELQ